MTIVDHIAGARLNEMIQVAHGAARAGRMDEAAHAWQQVLAVSPSHPQALFFLGQHSLHRGDARGARELFQRAAMASPKEPLVQLNLSFAHRALGDAANEMAALDAALTIDPYFYLALLSKGALLERSGMRRQAAKIYKNVLTIVPPDEQLIPELRKPVAHAREVVSENAVAMEAFLQDRLGGVRARHKGEKLVRFDECKDVAVGTKKVYTQLPMMLHFPGLPAIQYYDNADFPWLKGLAAGTDMIRDELIAALRDDSEGFGPYINFPQGVPVNQWAELNHSPRWSTFYLWKDGARVEEHCQRCPKTTALIETLPLIDIPRFGPTVLFSALAPRTRIPAHTGDTNARLVVHLPLILPPGCRFRVGNDTRPWRLGEAWVFDDTIEHEAWNDSDELRVILMIDIWNPYLSKAERELVGVLLNGVRDYYGEDAA